MSKSASDNRTCDKCGYVLSPFESDCPKCARLAVAHPAPKVSVPVTPDPELEEFKINLRRETDRRTRRNVIVIIISVVAAIIMTVPILFVFALAASSLGRIDASGFLWGGLLFVAVIAIIMYFNINRIAPYVPKSQIASEEEVGPWYNPIPYYFSKSQTPKNEKAMPWHKNPKLLFIIGLAAIPALEIVLAGIFLQSSVLTIIGGLLGLAFVIGWVVLWLFG